MNIILASNSPRRTEILSSINITHLVIPSNCEEVVEVGLKPYEVVESLSYQKANDVFSKHQDDIVIGADTIVVVDDIILGKPKDKTDAIKMLNMISGRCHEVITGVSIISNDKTITFHEVTKVYVKKLTLEEIEEYISIENVYDKAGSYAIQGIFAKYIDSFEGEYNNVVGLPINRLQKELEGYTDEI